MSTLLKASVIFALIGVVIAPDIASGYVVSRQEDAGRTIRQASSGMSRCYNAYLHRNRSNPDMPRALRVTFSITVEPNGEFTNERIIQIPVSDIAFTECLLGVVRPLHILPSHHAEPAFTFEPSIELFSR